MSKINIFDLHPAGYALLTDSESYMHPLSSAETDSIHGGDEPFNDLGDHFGYWAYGTAAALSAAATPVGSTLACSGAAVAASAQAFTEAYD